jgi:hypothetical protein
MKYFWPIFLLLCSGSALALGGMTELTYMDQEATGGGYVTRYLVTDRYLRLDYGRDREDFVLFDRKEKRVYNVNNDQREILVFEPGAVQVKPPKKWEIKEDLLDSNSSEKRVDLVVNGTVCTRLAAAQGFLPDVAQALQDFQEVMASTHAGTYLATPQDQRDDCDLARLILAPARWFKYGMPFDEVRSNGFSRRLLNYKTDVAVRPKALALPAGYRMIRFKNVQGTAP